MTVSQSEICNRIWKVLVSDPEPLVRPPNINQPTADEITNAANVDKPATKRCLRRLEQDGRLLTISDEGDSIYFPDPVKRYFDRLDEFLERHGAKPPVKGRGNVRTAVENWRDSEDIDSIEDVYEYRMGSRLVGSSRVPVGFNPFNYEWDVLVILDTCRIDALRSVVERMDGLQPSDVTARISLGSQTAEWLCKTFTTDHSDEISRTGYVSGNGWTKGIFDDGLRPEDEFLADGNDLPTSWNVVNGDDFGEIVNAWRQGKHEYTTEAPWGPHPEPRTITDHAVSLARKRPDLDRLVVHYKQPHFPYTESAKAQGRTELTKFEGAPYDVLADGGNIEPIWDAYLTDLRAAIDEVAALCRNIDGQIAITADHGEDFDQERRYLHRPTMLRPMVKRVPWATVSGSDERTRKSDLSSYCTVNAKVEEQLGALGYQCGPSST